MAERSNPSTSVGAHVDARENEGSGVEVVHQGSVGNGIDNTVRLMKESVGHLSSDPTDSRITVEE